MSTSALPLLLPQNTVQSSKESAYPEWTPKKFLQPPQPPPTDETRIHDMEMAVARQMLDGKALKKTRPRRTVDYGGGMGRWTLLRKLQPNTRYVPYLRPSPPYIIDLLPPKAYPDNASTSLCTKFVHTSTNKIRCPVNTVVWTPEGRRVLTGSTSGEFTLWNGLTFNFETILQAHDTAIRGICFTHSGAYLASADQSGIIKYFQPNMNNLTAWQGHREAIRGLSFSPDDNRFATASDDSTVRIWSFEESREERVLTGHGWDVKCVEWHPTMGLLVSGSKDNQIKFWDPRTGTSLTTLHQHKNTIQALSWSPNGNFVASASRDQTVRVFDIRAMKEFVVLRGHKKEVCSVAWHPVHPILVSGGSEGAVLHWDLSIPDPSTRPNALRADAPNAPPRATLSQAHDSNVWSVAFHPLGHLLASASNDHTTRFWCRERPGDATSVFSGGGEKPPTIVDLAGQDDDDDALVPGFGGGAGWWVQDDGAKREPRGDSGAPDGAGDFDIPGFGAADAVPGLGAAGGGSLGRQGAPLPPQEDVFGGGGEAHGGRDVMIGTNRGAEAGAEEEEEGVIAGLDGGPGETIGAHEGAQAYLVAGQRVSVDRSSRNDRTRASDHPSSDCARSTKPENQGIKLQLLYTQERWDAATNSSYVRLGEDQKGAYGKTRREVWGK
ncbi:WD40 repeat-like protein [Artomyces pyxidatus]|uniref:WD40 repeat-like protein n=1 Tax=Artomyces pyxidatus TaxID=48021 RepID=A0ACB8T1P4_9AGAM|nr:WD40 repeat-like protein [Artomyces pyxidatus]